MCSKNHAEDLKKWIMESWQPGLKARSRITEVTSSLSERSMRSTVMVINQRKAAFWEKQDSKRHKTFSIKFIMSVWPATGKYGKLILEITFSVVCIFLKCDNFKIP